MNKYFFYFLVLLELVGIVLLIAYGAFKADVIINEDDEEIEIEEGSINKKQNLLISANVFIWTPIIIFICTPIIIYRLNFTKKIPVEETSVDVLGKE
jgi:uncharacterized membrane protein